MAFGSFDKDSAAPMAEINTTPLVDVMLVLLVVFIVTAPLLTNAVDVNLPRAAATAHTERPDTIRLVVDAQGAYHWNDQPVGADQLTERFAAAVGTNPEITLALSADKDARYDAVAQAVAKAQQAGVSRIGFVTEAPSR
ncbi:biopolymer transporter ExbD [Crenobacter sp. SG2305]|uniref:ExbD/TolR family protein n=1 Tax=Crenobacter oryzisoli TaxID=3056844 RepID=UPI0025AA9EC5|nr:biopolymer transporter ExbD [Crenobacter sp. SG2305]MDN0084280.1 biopolymer transporter ExbD [Crenobacter sp. SG2305]